MAYLTCKNLTLGYEGHAIVSDLNFKVGKGDYLCIVGENGTGKSTLIKTLLHLQDAISGEVMAGDGLKAYEVGYLPQQTVVQKDFPATGAASFTGTNSFHILRISSRSFEAGLLIASS